ncbi:MAG: SMC-Scp complex subunit ScpB [Hyphomicrobiaceae bacterium]
MSEHEQEERRTVQRPEPRPPMIEATVEGDDRASDAPSETGAAGSSPAVGLEAKLRVLEAVLFAASEPLDVRTLAAQLPAGEDVAALLVILQDRYQPRGVNLVRVAGKWAFRTAADLAYLLERQQQEERRLSKAALETLAIIAYHQPVTRAEIEEIRGVVISKGTLDVLLETGWVRLRGRRRAPGRPITYGTTDRFLEQFGFDSIADLPGLAELKGLGLLDGQLPAGFAVPDPQLLADLQPDELPLEAADEEEDGEGEEPSEEASGV